MRQKNYIKHIWLVIIIAIVNVSTIAYLNYVTDWYSVFHKDPIYYMKNDNPINPVNYGYLRVKEFINNNHYDSILFSSSRGAIWDIDENFGTNWYKLTFLEGDSSLETLQTLKTISQRKKIKEIIILIDNFYFSQSFHNNKENKINRLLYPSSRYEQIKFYASYLFTELNFKNLFNLNKKLIPVTQRHPKATGKAFQGTHPLSELTTINTEAHLQKMTNITIDMWADTHLRIDKTLAEIKDIVDICAQRNIKVTFVVNPFHYKKMLNFNLYYIEYWKKELAKITPFYDFSGINKYTTNNIYWFELSHYTKLVADEMANFIKTKKKLDFGNYVTVQNANLNNTHIRKEIADYLQSNKIPHSSSLDGIFKSLPKKNDIITHGLSIALLKQEYLPLTNIINFLSDYALGTINFTIINKNASFKWDTRYSPENVKLFIFRCNIEVPKDTVFKVKSFDTIYQTNVTKGENQIEIILNQTNLDKFLEIFPGSVNGNYKITKMEIEVIQ